MKSVDAFRGGRRLVIECPQLAQSETPGASVNVNGVCLTVTDVDGATLAFDVVPETLSRSTLGALVSGDRVNLERSLRMGDPMGGHLVYGHVDDTSTIQEIAPEGPGARVWCSITPKLAPMIVEKGYVALDGVSLTIAEVAPDRRMFAVALIPETMKRTTFGGKREGDAINLEVDPVARYVESLLSERSERSIGR